MILRALLAFCAVAMMLTADGDAVAQSTTRPYRIYAITFRGMTDVERGFQDYFAARRIPVQGDEFGIPDFPNQLGRTGGVWLGAKIANQIALKLGISQTTIDDSKIS